MADQMIVCPKCGEKIPISQALRSQVEDDIRVSIEDDFKKKEKETRVAFEKKLADERARIERQAIKKAEQESNLRIEKLQSEINEAKKREKVSKEDFENRISAERILLEKKSRITLEKQFSSRLEKLQSSLKEKEKEVESSRKQAMELKKQKEQLDSREKRMDAEIKKKLEIATQKVQKEATEKIEDEYRTRELELEKKLSDARRNASELKRKLEQSSQQAQGEVLELELETVLKKAFPDDEIKEVAKGKSGADILQKVYNSNKQQCGTIIWESKNTQSWSKSWLPKLRTDQRKEKAELAILVSHILPKELAHFGQIEGVWVTEYPLALGVATALRINLIQAQTLRQSIQGKREKEKVELLFSYLSGTEFKNRVEAIVEAFRTMEDDLKKERQAFEKHWASREKQLQLVIQNISGMYGDLQGIIGSALPRIRHLELSSS